MKMKMGEEARVRLLSRRAALLGLSAANRAKEGALDALGERDWPDRAALTAEAAVLHRLGECEHLEVLDIEAALLRIDEGRYGHCDRCGQAIGRQRLAAIPEASHCLTCLEEGGINRSG